MVASINPYTFLVESDGNLGAVEVTTFLSLILYGVSLTQGYTYFQQQNRREDRFSLKLFVSLILVLETFHSFSAAMAVYYDTVTRWRNAESNSYPIAVNILIETLITLLVQCFFSYRIYRLSERASISIFCAFLAVIRFIGGMATCVEDFLDVPNTHKWDWLCSTCDVLVAAFMTYYLRKLVSPRNFKSTTNVLNSLIRWSLQTGIITSITSIAVITSFQTMQNMIWFSLYIILAKVYSNSLLVSLNARSRLNRQGNSTTKPMSTGLRFDPPISISFHTAISDGTRDGGNFSPPSKVEV